MTDTRYNKSERLSALQKTALEFYELPQADYKTIVQGGLSEASERDFRVIGSLDAPDEIWLTPGLANLILLDVVMALE